MRLFKTKLKNGYLGYYLLGICIYKRYPTVGVIMNDFARNKSFDTRSFDERIANYVNSLEGVQKLSYVSNVNHNKIGFLATELYDMGGHTECIKNMGALLSDTYEQTLFLSKLKQTLKFAPKKITIISKYAKIDSIDYNIANFEKNLIDLYIKIVTTSPKVLFVFMHMNDVLGTALLYLLKKYTKIKIIYCNHGSHWPALGFSFADLVLEGMPSTQYVTEHFRKTNKCCVVGLALPYKNNNHYYTQKEIKSVRDKWDVKEDELVSLTGCSSYKLFNNNESEYFEMIQRLLRRIPNLKHVVITNLCNNEKRLINNIFADSPDLLKRVVFEKTTPDFEKFFQASNVFIDSFPIGSALTQVDLMRNKVPTVVKINKDNSLFSFHEYMPSDYPYMFEKIADMEEGIVNLLKNKSERKRMADILYQHYLSNFEGTAVRKKYIKIIEDSDNIEQFYTPCPDGKNYNFMELE